MSKPWTCCQFIDKYTHNLESLVNLTCMSLVCWGEQTWENTQKLHTDPVTTMLTSAASCLLIITSTRYLYMCIRLDISLLDSCIKEEFDIYTDFNQLSHVVQHLVLQRDLRVGHLVCCLWDVRSQNVCKSRVNSVSCLCGLICSKFRCREVLPWHSGACLDPGTPEPQRWCLT